MLKERKIQTVFKYGTGEKGDGPPDETTLRGMRTSAHVSIMGGWGQAVCSARIYGMSLSLMNTLSRVGPLAMWYRNNTITLSAGDDEIGLAQIFQGTVTSAWPDFNNAPEVGFWIEASAGTLDQLKPTEPISYPGTADAAVMLQNICAKMDGVRFENNGVSVILPPTYKTGDLRSQAASIVKDAGIEWNGIENGVMAIWPKGGSRKGSIVKIDKSSGMIGYPSYTSWGIIVKTIFNPTLSFGRMVEVESILTPANGQYQIVQLDHVVDALVPGGAWQTIVSLKRQQNIEGKNE